jgi:Na+-transporting methylmalonyl-CoA/oxaloacetate decarboxylase gamma subunit
MYSAFGLYLSAVGIALVFATLLAIGLLSEVTRRMFLNMEEPLDRKVKPAKAAAIAAVLMLTGSEVTYRPSAIATEGDERWKAAARNEAVDRGMGQER